MTKKVVITGSGISALFTAWACEQEKDVEFKLLSKSVQKPKVVGFQYLHGSCDLSVRKSILEEKTIQNNIAPQICSDLYSLKVYGKPGIKNSIDKINEIHPIWDLSQAVDYLWEKYKDKIEYSVIATKENFNKIPADIIFNTIPLNVFEFHDCSCTTAYVTTFPVKSNLNQVYYDVLPESSTYRFGIIFGNLFIESTKYTDYSIHVQKVISNQYIPEFPARVINVGRYAEWNKDVLVSDVYYRVRQVLNGKKI
jgi:hypothetical protein